MVSPLTPAYGVPHWQRLNRRFDLGATSRVCCHRPFERRDRDQLTAPANSHVSAVIPGVVLSVNTVLGQLEREPYESIVDPWGAERLSLVASRTTKSSPRLCCIASGRTMTCRRPTAALAASGGWSARSTQAKLAQGTGTEAPPSRCPFSASQRAASTSSARVGGPKPASGCHGVPGTLPQTNLRADHRHPPDPQLRFTL
jgi:hypothetical protein